MKKLILLLGAVLIGLSSFAQINGKQIRNVQKELKSYTKKAAAKKPKYDLTKLSSLKKLPTEKTHYEWNNNNWEFYYSSEIKYSPDGRILEETQTDLTKSVIIKVSYLYNSNNKPIAINSDLKAGNTWVPYTSTIIDYNAEGDIILFEDRYYNSGNWEIMNGLKYDITYNNMTGTKSIVNSYFTGLKYDTTEMYIEYYNNNILIMEETQVYNPNSGFVPVDQHTYLFDSNGVDTGMIRRAWDGTNWNDDLLYCNYKWDNATKDFLSENTVYTSVGTSWFIYQRETYTRDNFGSFMYLSEFNFNGNWVGDIRIANMLDQYGSRVAYIYDMFTNGQWVQLFRISEDFTYDNEGNILEHIYKETDSNGDLQNLYKDTFSGYQLPSGFQISKIKSLRFYPNPTSSYIQLTDELALEVYEIKNLAGQVIRRGKVDDTAKIYFDGLEKGMYLVFVKDFQAKVIKR